LSQVCADIFNADDAAGPEEDTGELEFNPLAGFGFDMSGLSNMAKAFGGTGHTDPALTELMGSFSKISEMAKGGFGGTGFTEIFNELPKMMNNANQYQENHLNSLGVDIEKFREQQQTGFPTAEEMKGKTSAEIEEIHNKKQEAQIRENFSRIEKKLPVEFFNAVKPKYKPAEPDRAAMIAVLNEYVTERAAGPFNLSDAITNIKGLTADELASVRTVKFKTIEELINFQQSTNPVSMTELPVLTFKRAYFAAIELIDEYCECCRTDKKMREFSAEDEAVDNYFLPKKEQPTKPASKKARRIDD